ncbi:amidase [Orrella marina]|uniref:Amidase n=1 Tax=Orrella marina TaxID=2163011 RepID=A0A2R4XHW1_9BURK|nr:amidase [Orrella marina]AWB33396.1 amidase [Orrella marina]
MATEPHVTGNYPEGRPLWQWSASALRQGYLDGSITPVDAITACLERITEINPVINAFVAENTHVLQDAHASTQRYRRGQPRSNLDGIPVSIKDNLCTADMPTTWGTPALQHYRPRIDELPVSRLRASGALIVGKTNVPEFTLEGYTDNPLFGVTRNPWNTLLTPGGSSGGAAASVSAGCTPLAIGTDGGGSIRRPASHCGLAGLKPSIGSVARDKGLPPLLLDFEVVGPVARTVGDLRMLFEVLRGPNILDRHSLAAQTRQSVADAHTRASKPLRILYVPTLSAAPVDAQIARSCQSAMEHFQTMGHQVTVGEMPMDLSPVMTGWATVGQVGLAALFEQHPQWSDGASPKYLQMAQSGAQVRAPELLTLIDAVTNLRAACVDLFEQWDVIAMPSAAALPWPAEQAYPPEIDGHAVGPRGHAVFTGWVNVAGLPAISVPTPPSDEGLPIGLQLIAAYAEDDFLIELARAYENHSPWAHRWPDIL